jgi:hypothetical protein
MRTSRVVSLCQVMDIPQRVEAYIASQSEPKQTLSANTTGISVYVLGLDDKTLLARTYEDSIGKATITGYCIKFRRLSVVDADVLQAAIRHGMSLDHTGSRA